MLGTALLAPTFDQYSDDDHATMRRIALKLIRVYLRTLIKWKSTKNKTIKISSDHYLYDEKRPHKP